jgi:hypothetical protein
MKTLIAGFCGAFAAIAMWIVVTIVLPIALDITMARFGAEGTGVGFAYVSELQLLIAAAAGFAIAAAYSRRRQRRMAR